MKSYREIETICKQIRRNIVTMSCEKRTSHVGSAFSMVEILAVLYFAVLRIDPTNPKAPDRDIFILSKGHACLALYNVLALAGFFPIERLATYCEFGSGMGGHPERHLLPGVEVCSGALGHGLSMAVGMALASKRDGIQNRVVVLMGDGELQEGSIWEASMAASHYGLDNLIAIVDRNHLQADSRTEEVMSLEPLDMKWRSFGWNVALADGHNMPQLSDVLREMYNTPKPGVPNVLIARTVKGKGVSFMEDNQAWHFNVPTPDEVSKALEELS